MPLPIPTHIPPIGPQTDPTKVNVAVVVGGQLASAPARGIGLTAEELAALDAGGTTSAAADMSIGFRTSGNRFVVNDKADMSGTDVMTVSEAGLVTASGSIASTAGQVTAGGGYFIGSPTWAFIGPAAGGTPSGLVLRPTAYNSSTGETYISPAGTMTTGANIIANGSVQSAAGIYASPTLTLYLRPNGTGSTTGQGQIATSGMATFAYVNATNYITGDLYVAGGTFAGSAFANSGNGVLNRSDGCCLHKSAGTAAFSVAAFFNNATYGVSGGAQVGSITTSGSATTFNTSSDEVLKDFIGLYDPLSAIEIIRADPVRDFTWKNGDGYAVGWGAQTSYNVSQDLATPPPLRSPEEIAIEGTPGTDPKEPGYVPWGMDQGKRTPYLWAALSWALDRIDELEARIAALETK